MNRTFSTRVIRVIVILSIVIMFFPVYMTIVGSTHSMTALLKKPVPVLPGPHFLDNMKTAIFSGAQSAGKFSASGLTMLKNTLLVSLGITTGKICISFLAAYALSFFKFPGKELFFRMVLITLMLPLEVRIIPTYAITASLGLLNSYGGIILPSIASATATFIYRQTFAGVPEEITEAAMIDGAGPLTFMWWILLPMTKTITAALVVILFIYGWNLYLWPLIITTDPQLHTIVVGIYNMLNAGDQQAEWNVMMAATLLAMIPPVLIIITMQKQFIEGMNEKDK
ncbi:sn-glycerol-3-phosphate ABC transporter permease UgpE [Marispirochaeta sp.]|jgi:sn-glycerol 3-phosphate transport system permease protein|uniref:sn-glycerol-3-phosphate ABC transporter permease UgpE n=1 Tax=Marispirochaeta sp. TaxID=2038653 RepID=UPI0029C70B7E|nr:sn-glycerol-3-phosphate ABC transporter permease UgpE [Marispirochaeta sp.]